MSHNGSIIYVQEEEAGIFIIVLLSSFVRTVSHSVVSEPKLDAFDDRASTLLSWLCTIPLSTHSFNVHAIRIFFD